MADGREEGGEIKMSVVWCSNGSKIRRKEQSFCLSSYMFPVDGEEWVGGKRLPVVTIDTFKQEYNGLFLFVVLSLW